MGASYPGARMWWVPPTQEHHTQKSKAISAIAPFILIPRPLSLPFLLLPLLATEAAELGVHRGEFSERILSIWKKGRLHMVDVWGAVDHYLYDRNDDLNQAINRVSKFGSKRYKIVRNLTS